MDKHTQTHTHVQGCCQRTYGPCHCTQTLSVRSLIGSERTTRQWTVTPLIRGDIAALSGQPRSRYCHTPYHKFTFKVIVFLLITCTTHGSVSSNEWSVWPGVSSVFFRGDEEVTEDGCMLCYATIWTTLDFHRGMFVNFLVCMKIVFPLY